MIPRRGVLIVVGALLLAGCDDAVPAPVPGSSDSSPATAAPAGGGVRFVGNSTCTIVNQKPYSPQPPGTHGAPIGEVVAEMPHYHVAPPATVQYEHDPPTSGCHYTLGLGQAPITPGVYNQTVVPERWVHNLEHGYVAVLYNCGDAGCGDALAALTHWFQSLPADAQAGKAYAKVIVLPWPSMQAHFACVSWDWYLGMDQLDLTRVKAFYNNHIDEAPEGNSTA